MKCLSWIPRPIWSFVGKKDDKQWIWLALDAKTKEIVGVHVGDRSRTEAKKLWQSLPAVYRQCAVCYSDFWSAYEQVIPSKRHKSQRSRAYRLNVANATWRTSAAAERP